MEIDDLVSRLMFGVDPVHIDSKGIAALGFEYRAKKTPADFRLAVQRGRDAGRGKVELEEAEIAVRLTRVLKKKRPIAA